MTEFSAPMFANAVARALGRPYALRPQQVAADGSVADLVWQWGGVGLKKGRTAPNPKVGEWRPHYEVAAERRQHIRIELPLGSSIIDIGAWIEHRAHHGWVGLRHASHCCTRFWLSFEPDGSVKTDNLWRRPEDPLEFEPEEAAFLHRLNRELGGAISTALRGKFCINIERQGMSTLLKALETGG